MTDRNNVERKTGEEWLIRTAGSYLPQVHEEIIQVLDPYILDNTRSLHLRATKAFTDIYKIDRKAGEEYLITLARTSFHIVDVYEEFVGMVYLTVLDENSYCVILNPVDEETQKNKLGASILVKGPKTFFLKPGEELDGGIKKAYILSEDQALLLKAKESVSTTEIVKQDGKSTEIIRNYEPGNKWMIYGPCNYIPPNQVEVIEVRQKIPLDKNEGIYVRDTRTGEVRTVFGQAYLLKSHEELWEMSLPDNVERLLAQSYFQANN